MQRLKTRPQFQAVLSSQLVATSCHFALHRLGFGGSLDHKSINPFPSDGVWVGAMAPKRWAKRATTRNAIKRQIYTACRALDQQIDAAFVVRLRREFSRKEFVSASSTALKNAARLELQTLFQSFLQTTAKF